VRLGREDSSQVNAYSHELFYARCQERKRRGVVVLNLQPGEHTELEGSMKGLIQNRFFKFIERKFIYFAIPLALIAFVSKPVVHLRKPGAILSLTWSSTVDLSGPFPNRRSVGLRMVGDAHPTKTSPSLRKPL